MGVRGVRASPERAAHAFRRVLAQRFFLRWHMALILTGVALSGLFTNTALLRLGVHSMALRYGMAVVAAYLVLFGAVRLWLVYISRHAGRSPASGGGDWLDGVPIPDVSGRGAGEAVPFRFGGGRTGGGGAGGGFDVGSAAQASEEIVPAVSSEGGAGRVADAASGGVGSVISSRTQMMAASW